MSLRKHPIDRRVVDLRVRVIEASDRLAWAEMRAALWPEASSEEHARDIDDVLRSDRAWGFIAEVDGTPAGFAELAIRDYANGCASRPVPFLEGIFVREEYRRRGIGARLVAYLEEFAAARGFTEIGSDAEIANLASHAAHRCWGFVETERVVYFRKVLGA
jgi:aminoglycoside 6'-N-acetyltransferase I